MPWHDATPWRKRHQKRAVSVEQRLDEIEGKCRAGDIGLRQAIEAAYRVGAQTVNQAETAAKE